MEVEQAARIALSLEMRGLGDLGAIGVERDDLFQEARIGVYLAGDKIAPLDEPQRSAAMIRFGRSAIVDFLRKHGGTGAARAVRRLESEPVVEVGDPWENAPEKLMQAFETWDRVCRLPIKFQMLTILIGVGFSAADIASVTGLSESRISQLRSRVGRILEQLA